MRLVPKQCYLKNKLGKTQARAKKEINMVAFDKEWSMRLSIAVESIKHLESKDKMNHDELLRWNFWKEELNNLLFGYI
jgi:hypothetical protein